MLKANKITAEFLYNNIKSMGIVRIHAFLNDNKFVEITKYMIANRFNVEFQDPKALNDFLVKLKDENPIKYIVIFSLINNLTNLIILVSSTKVKEFHATCRVHLLRRSK